MKIPLATVPERTSGREFEGAGDAIRTPVPVFEHVSGDDEAAPGQQSLRRRETFCAQSLGDSAAGMCQETRKSLRRQAFVRACHREKHGVGNHGVDPVQRLPDKSREALRFGHFDERKKRPRRIVPPSEYQSVHTGAPGIEQIVPAINGHVHVRNEREPRQPLFELANAFEIRRALPVEIEHRHPHRFTVTRPNESRPIGAFLQFVTVADRGTKPLYV